jgi:hypothetical protein
MKLLKSYENFSNKEEKTPMLYESDETYIYSWLKSVSDDDGVVRFLTKIFGEKLIKQEKDALKRFIESIKNKK